VRFVAKGRPGEALNAIPDVPEVGQQQKLACKEVVLVIDTKRLFESADRDPQALGGNERGREGEEEGEIATKGNVHRAIRRGLPKGGVERTTEAGKGFAQNGDLGVVVDGHEEPWLGDNEAEDAMRICGERIGLKRVQSNAFSIGVRSGRPQFLGGVR
jgi:hypothetical protein